MSDDRNSNRDVRGGAADDSDSLRSERLVPDDKLCRDYERLVRRVALKFGFGIDGCDHEGMEMEDAMQAGYIGLLEAARTFDPSAAGVQKKHPFAYWATIHVRREISDAIQNSGWTKSRRKRIAAHHRDFMEDPAETNVEDIVANQEWLDKIDAAVAKLDPSRRDVFTGVMLHDDVPPKSKQGVQPYEWMGLSYSHTHQIRKDIRRKLHKALH